MNRGVTIGLGFAFAILAAGAGAQPAPTGSNDSAVFTSVKLPDLKHGPGDVVDPLPADAAYPSADPRNLEGNWASFSATSSIDGSRPAYKPEVQAAIKRVMELEAKGTPIVRKGTLCRSDGPIGITLNQFPTMIIQRPDKIVFISEENRNIWHVHMNAEHPANLKPSHLGHSVGRWEGNTLVVDTVGFIDRPTGLGAGNSPALHIVTKFTRANTGDKRNGDRLLMERTIEDPRIYDKPYTVVNISRWRPDLDMLEFNCEESTPASQAAGVTVE